LFTSFDYRGWQESNQDLSRYRKTFPLLNRFYEGGSIIEVKELLNELTSVEEEPLDTFAQSKYPSLVRHISSGDVANMRRLATEITLMEPRCASRSGYVARLLAALLS
jgi:hypothetical protein